MTGNEKTNWDSAIPARLNALSGKVIDAAFAVHSTLGPGLLENVYEICLCLELKKRDLKVDRQVSLPIDYDGVRIDGGLRMEVVVDSSVIVEIKAVEEIHPVHKAQLLTYLKLTGYRLGLLVNFNVPVIRDGITRVVR